MKKKNVKIAALFVAMVFVVGSLFAQKQYTYRTFKNDPMGVREYTLDNGLKVYMSVYKDAPRIQTYIAVRAGSKNDPPTTTGLAHYLEHMLFKGTQKLGTTDWEKEGPIIQQIEDLFEVYRMFDDSATRAVIYHKIDSLSYEASKISVANEYDKAMTAIGSTGTNAFTSNDYTMYVENIPSNQLESWAMVQGDRFQNMVLRLFHTELEAVYEEKNISLAKDGRKSNETLMAALFPHHPYGQQTTLGTIEHLKNPSMRNIRNYFSQYYVPNNMCVAMSGDFDPDEAIRIIDKYMGCWKPGQVPEFHKVPEAPITSPIVRTVTGLDPENLTMAYRIDAGYGSREVLLAGLLGEVLSNGKCGLIDLNINQAQKCMSAYAGPYTLNDYTAFMLSGRPLQGQSLDEVKDLLLQQIELVKQGKFEEWLLEAAVNNMEYAIQKRAESNNSRASQMAYVFVQHEDWGDVCNEVNELRKITKQELVAFANQVFRDGAYAVVYKRQGTPEPVVKVTKPAITPIEVNRDKTSAFLSEIKSRQVTPIEPVFVDFKKDLQKTKLANGSELLYVKNEENSTFTLNYYFDFGSYADKTIDLAADLLEYLGTSKHTADQLNEEFYRLACSYSMSVSGKTINVHVSGLSKNMEKALALVEEIFSDVQPNDEALRSLTERIIKSRKDSKSNQQTAFRALNQYAMYGDNSSYKDVLTDEQLRAYTSRQLVDAIHGLFAYQHRVLYYGDATIDQVKATVAKVHKTPKSLKKVPANKNKQPVAVSANQVLFCDYDAKNSYVNEYFRGGKYDVKLMPQVTLYNEYFGGSMNAIVFQEMREKRSLAYSASAYYSNTGEKDGYFFDQAQVITQNDKLLDALTAYEDLFLNMPEAQANFDLAKESCISSLRTSRTTKFGIINRYLTFERMGWKDDPNKTLFNALPTMTMQDVVNFNNKYVKGQKKCYIILGKESDTDFNALGKYGKVKKVRIDDLFAY
ncbi:MAG: insulinase family protein [Bacteroidales bacterium]|nr:insulinase family protein [Bacteroidales bacterium]